MAVSDPAGDLAEWGALTGRIYADRDFTPGGREVALALAWVLYRDPQPPGNRWRRAREILGITAGPPPQWRIWGAIGEDIPYYDPGSWTVGAGECEGPRVRPYRSRREPLQVQTIVHDHSGPAAGPERHPSVCGAHATICVTEYDPVTGWETAHWFCSRHRERAREVRVQLAAALPVPPPPIPNRGGVLPRYFEADWAARYEAALRHPAGWRTPVPYGWQPPYHGLCRDDWPVPGQTTVPRRPRLAVVS
jgi:hypothetical protein